MSDKPHDVYGRYSDENVNKELPWCKAGFVIEGEWYPCDLVPPHPGWAHSNRESQALWHCGESND